jgi:hypothetical protein
MAQQLPNRRRHYPGDILHNIASRITNPGDLCNFARCSIFTWDMGEDMLWKMDIAKPGKRVLYWAIERTNLVVAGKALEKYVELDALGLIAGAGVQWDEFTWRDGTLARDRPTAPVMLAVEHGSMEMLALVVFRAIAAGHNLDTFCRIRPDVPAGWHIHELGGPDLCLGCADTCRGRCFVPFPNSLRVIFEPVSAEGPNSCESAMHMAVWGVRPDMLRFLLDYVATKGGVRDACWRTCCLARLLVSVEYSAYKTVSGPSSKDPVYHQMRQMLAEVFRRQGVDIPVIDPKPSRWRKLCTLSHIRKRY